MHREILELHINHHAKEPAQSTENEPKGEQASAAHAAQECDLLHVRHRQITFASGFLCRSVSRGRYRGSTSLSRCRLGVPDTWHRKRQHNDGDCKRQNAARGAYPVHQALGEPGVHKNPPEKASDCWWIVSLLTPYGYFRKRASTSRTVV